MPIIYDEKAEIRRDYFLNKYVIITPSRAKRPRDVQQSESQIPKEDIFSPEAINTKWKDLIVDTIGGKKNWTTVALLNRFPAVTLKNTKAYGIQEVVVEGRKSGIDLGSMTLKQINEVLQMYAKRTKAIAKIPNIDYILIFKNQGGAAGASLLHSHSQIFAIKHIPPDVYYELDKAQEHKLKTGVSVYEDIIDKEEKSARHIFSDKHVVAFAPYASEFHYEAWVFTRRRVDNISQLTKAERHSLARALKLILGKLNSINHPYNFFMHQVVSFKEQHFYIKIQPRGSVWAGIELGSGIVINSVSPEKAALFYKK